MTALLVLRPEPGCSETVSGAREMGMEAFACPLFTIEPLAQDLPDPDRFDAVLVTSANGARHGGDVLSACAALPVFVVGEGSARAVRAAGSSQVRVGAGDAASTVPLILKAGHRSVLHVCGEDVVPFDAAGLIVERCVVYRAATRPMADVADCVLAHDHACILVHSPRAGARLAEIVPESRRSAFAVVGISDNAVRACGTGWQALQISEQKSNAAMLALAARICQYDSL